MASAKPPSEEAVPNIHGLAVHKWATPFNWFNTAIPTGFYCLNRHAAIAEGTVKPDVANPLFEGGECDFCRNRRMCCDNDSVHCAGHGRYVWIAFQALNFGNVRVDRYDLVAGFSEFSEDRICWGRARAGNAGDDDSLTRKEFRNCLGYLWHGGGFLGDT